MVIRYISEIRSKEDMHRCWWNDSRKGKKGHRGGDEATRSRDLHMSEMSAESSAGHPCWASALTIGARVGVKDSVGT
jgi:hypothetical protein